MTTAKQTLAQPLRLPRRNILQSFWREIASPVPSTMMWAFQVFFAFHVALQGLKLDWRPAGIPGAWILPVQILLFVAAFATIHRRGFYPGFIVLLLFRLNAVIFGYPMTANHHYAELYIIILLLLWPERLPSLNLSQQTGESRSTSRLLILLMILTIYFYSGVHKIIYGMWLSGEFVAHGLFNESSGLDYTTKMLLQFLSGTFGLSLPALPINWPAGIDQVAIQIPVWVMVVLLGLSWVTVLSEVCIPLLVISKRFRNVGLWLMTIMTIMIGVTSLEIEFVYTSIGCLLLLVPNRHVRNFAILLLIHIIWSVGIHLDGFQSGAL